MVNRSVFMSKCYLYINKANFYVHIDHSKGFSLKQQKLIIYFLHIISMFCLFFCALLFHSTMYISHFSIFFAVFHVFTTFFHCIFMKILLILRNPSIYLDNHIHFLLTILAQNTNIILQDNIFPYFSSCELIYKMQTGNIIEQHKITDLTNLTQIVYTMPLLFNGIIPIIFDNNLYHLLYCFRMYFLLSYRYTV